MERSRARFCEVEERAAALFRSREGRDLAGKLGPGGEGQPKAVGNLLVLQGLADQRPPLLGALAQLGATQRAGHRTAAPVLLVTCFILDQAQAERSAGRLNVDGHPCHRTLRSGMCSLQVGALRPITAGDGDDHLGEEELV